MKSNKINEKKSFPHWKVWVAASSLVGIVSFVPSALAIDASVSGSTRYSVVNDQAFKGAASDYRHQFSEMDAIIEVKNDSGTVSARMKLSGDPLSTKKLNLDDSAFDGTPLRGGLPRHFITELVADIELSSNALLEGGYATVNPGLSEISQGSGGQFITRSTQDLLLSKEERVMGSVKYKMDNTEITVWLYNASPSNAISPTSNIQLSDVIDPNLKNFSDQVTGAISVKQALGENLSAQVSYTNLRGAAPGGEDQHQVTAGASYIDENFMDAVSLKAFFQYARLINEKADDINSLHAQGEIQKGKLGFFARAGSTEKAAGDWVSEAGFGVNYVLLDEIAKVVPSLEFNAKRDHALKETSAGFAGSLTVSGATSREYSKKVLKSGS